MVLIILRWQMSTGGNYNISETSTMVIPNREVKYVAFLFYLVFTAIVCLRCPIVDMILHINTDVQHKYKECKHNFFFNQ